MMSKNPNFTVLVNSCDAFEDCWLPFFKLFSKYWPECDARVLLNTESNDWACDFMRVECTQIQGGDSGRLPWSECFIRALDQVRTPLVLYFQEDYFIDRPVRADLIDRAVAYMIARPEVKHVGLTKHGSSGPYLQTDEAWLHCIRQDARYRISTQAGLWRADTLKSYLRPEENGWMFEIFGTWRASRRDELFLCADHDPSRGGAAIEYLHTGIIKGRWLLGIQKTFEANGIDVDYSHRGFYVPKHPLLHKFEVGSRLLERPWYFLEQYLWAR